MTATFNPIIGRAAITGWNPLGRPEPEPGVAIVLMRDGRPTHVLQPDDRHVARSIKWNNYQCAYYVDVSQHTMTFQCQLPCIEHEHHFEAEVYVVYWASDPRRIVQRRVSDARALVEPELMRRMRLLSRDYKLEECAEAESRIQTDIMKQPLLPEFTVERFSISLRMEEEERAHVRRKRALERNHEYSMRHAQLREQISNEDTIYARQQIHFYNELIRSGYGQLLLLHLCNNGEIQPVLQGLNEQMRGDREHWLRMFNLLREADGLEGFQLDALREQVLKRLTEGEQSNGTSPPQASANPKPGNGANSTPIPVAPPNPKPGAGTSGASAAQAPAASKPASGANSTTVSSVTIIPPERARAVGEKES